jgi:hypothetical protein
MENNELIASLNKELSLTLHEKMSDDEVCSLLAAYINDLIKNDFEKLIAYLYRIDVSEQKLKSLLQQHPQEDAGNIIASLIIERQKQKIKTRQQFDSRRDNSIEDAEKW